MNLLRKRIEKILRIKDFEFEIYRKSIDARKGIVFTYQVIVDASLSKKQMARIKNASYYVEEDFTIPEPHKKSRVVIVGSGPAGLFCAYILAKYGCKPIIIEQGEKVEDRMKTIEAFLQSGKLNPFSNVQFGEGGAGTYSDGKLTARTKDKRQREVLKLFVEHGGPVDIMYEAKPHIGTDVLRKVISSMRDKIIELGGEYHFNTKFQDLEIRNGRVAKFIVDGKNIEADAYVLALGNSARESFKVLAGKIPMSNKPFAVGFRIEHKREYINFQQYKTDRKDLPTASYSLKHTDKEKGLSAYTFCMCPGGHVVNSSSEDKRLVVNGMSYHHRDGENSNSALIVTVNENIYGNKLLDGMDFQRKIEEKAYKLGGSNFNAPVQRVEDFIENRETTSLGHIEPSVRPNYKLTNLRGLYPKEIDDFIIESLISMDKRLKGFAMADGILTGVETRSSSPVRMARDEHLKSQGTENLFVIGEGSGFAGGIVSSAIDGIKAAENIIKGH